MKDKEKQIEEMARAIEKMDFFGTDNYARKLSPVSINIIATNFFKQGYRKIPEGSVVLTKGEAQKYYAYKHIEPQIKGCLDREVKLERQLKEARKETAREILKWLVDTGMINIAPDTTKMYFKEKFGVEVEE